MPTTLAYPTGLTYVSGTNNPQNYINALQSGPIGVGIRADTEYFRYFKSGVIKNSCCGERLRLNHAVVIVGYSIDANE